MLQINIIHDKNTHYIGSVFRSESSELICEFDPSTQKTDIEKLKPYIGADVVVNHTYQDGREPYMIQGILTDVELSDDGFWYIEYQSTKNISSDTI